jgi:hypothetical protein
MTIAKMRPVRVGRPASAGVLLFAALLLAVLLLSAAPKAVEANPGVVTVGATLESDVFTVRAQKEGTAETALIMAEQAWSELAPRFAVHPTDRVVIVVVEDSSEYERIQPAPMTRGFATFGGRHVYILGDQLDQEVVTHELVHILLGLNVRQGLWIPDWFNEGVAQWASGSRASSLELMYSASAGNLLPLQDLDHVDALRGPDRQLATIEGLAVVDFLADSYGENAVWRLVWSLSDARSFDQALAETFGYTDLELNSQWMAYAEENYDLLSPAGIRVLATLAFVGLLLLAVVAWVVRKAAAVSKMALEPPLTAEEVELAARAESEWRSLRALAASHEPPGSHDPAESADPMRFDTHTDPP